MAYPGQDSRIPKNSLIPSHLPLVINDDRHPNSAVNQFEEQPGELKNDCEGNPNRSSGDTNRLQTSYRRLMANSASAGKSNRYETNSGVQNNILDCPSQQENAQSYRPVVVDREAHGFDGSVQRVSHPPQLTAHPESEPDISPQTIEFLSEDPADPENATRVRERENAALLRQKERDLKTKSEDEYQQGRARDKSEKRARRKEMESLGGACLLCYLMKIECSRRCPNCSNCQKKGWVCLRGSKKLQLHCISSPPGDMGRSGSTPQATINTISGWSLFRADALIRELCSLTDPFVWGSVAVLEFQCSQLDSLEVATLDTKLLTEFPGFADLASLEFLESRLLNIVPTPQFTYFPNVEESTVLQTSASMLRLLALFISIPNAHFFAPAGYRAPGKATLAFLLVYLAKSIADKSEVFTSDLIQRVRQRRQKKPTPYDVWLATGVYYNVVACFSNFEPPAMISEIFTSDKRRLVEVCAALRNILELTHRPEFGKFSFPSEDEDPNNKESWPTFAKPFPVPYICRPLKISFYFNSKVPTALGRQFTPFSLDPIAVCNLLNSDVHEGHVVPTQSLFSDNHQYLSATGVENLRTATLQDQVLQDENRSPLYDSVNAVEGSLFNTAQSTEISAHDDEDSTLVGANTEENRPVQSFSDPTFGSDSSIPDPSTEDSLVTHSPMNSTSTDDLLLGCGTSFETVYSVVKTHYDNTSRRGHKRNISSISSSSNQSPQDLYSGEYYDKNDCLGDMYQAYPANVPFDRL